LKTKKLDESLHSYSKKLENEVEESDSLLVRASDDLMIQFVNEFFLERDLMKDHTASM
jgi:hypothetical protein